RLFPSDGAAAADAARAANVLRQLTHEELGTKRRLPKLRVGEPQVVMPLGHVVGELVGEAEAQPERRAVGTDHVDAGELRLFAAVPRERGARERLLRLGEVFAVALVEPLGLLARDAIRRPAALHAFE